MKPATALAVLAFSILPSFAAFAECMGGHSAQTAASCVPGMVWDAAKGTCVNQPTS